MLRFLANESKIRNAMSQSLSFHVPLDKGNEGSGNEIVTGKLCQGHRPLAKINFIGL